MAEEQVVLNEKLSFGKRTKAYLSKKWKTLVSMPFVTVPLIAGGLFLGTPNNLEARVAQSYYGQQVTVTGIVTEEDDYINRNLDVIIDATVVQDDEKKTEYTNPVSVLIHEDYIRGFNGNGEAIWDARSLLNSGDFIIHVIGSASPSDNPDYEFILDPDLISFIKPDKEDGTLYATIDTNVDTRNLFKAYKSNTTFQLYTQPLFWPSFMGSFWFWQDWDMDGIPNGYDRYPYSHDWGWGLWGGSTWGLGWGWNPYSYGYYNRGWRNPWAGWYANNYYHDNYNDFDPDIRSRYKPTTTKISKKQLQVPTNVITRYSLDQGTSGSKVRLQNRVLQPGTIKRIDSGTIKKYESRIEKRNIKRDTTSRTRIQPSGTANRGTTSRTGTRDRVSSGTARTTPTRTTPPKVRARTRSTGKTTSTVKKGSTTKTKKIKKDESYSSPYKSNTTSYTSQRRSYQPMSTLTSKYVNPIIKRFVPKDSYTKSTPSRRISSTKAKSYISNSSSRKTLRNSRGSSYTPSRSVYSTSSRSSSGSSVSRSSSSRSSGSSSRSSGSSRSSSSGSRVKK